MIGFDPSRGSVLVAPPAGGTGSWAGAPGAFRNGADLFVAYRLRRPQPVRGFELRVAAVRGGRVDDLCVLPKEAFRAESMERAALVRATEAWRLYVSYVDAQDRKWRIAMLESRSVDGFDARDIRVVLHPDAVGMSAVKDPWLRRIDGRWFMFVSCGRRADDPAHRTGDVLSTGVVRSETGLATSDDGVAWRWEGVVFEPSANGWDRSTTRLTTAYREGDGWLGYYDGAASIAENYEERCGIARALEPSVWKRLSPDGPAVGTARGAGGVRYVDVTSAGDIFWEHTREDGSHELRGLVRS